MISSLDDGRRSLSCSDVPNEGHREVIIVQDHPWGEGTKDGLGIQWQDAISCITEHSGPQDRLVRYLFARRLLRNGFSDRGGLRSVLEFSQPLSDHVRG